MKVGATNTSWVKNIDIHTDFLMDTTEMTL